MRERKIKQGYERKHARRQVGGSQKEAREDLAEGWEGAPTGRAPGTPQTDAATEAGRKAVQLRPSSGRLRQEVGIASGCGGPHPPESRAYLLQHSLGPRSRLSLYGPECTHYCIMLIASRGITFATFVALYPIFAPKIIFSLQSRLLI